MSKRRVWLCQSNTLFGRSCFLPYSVGIVQAYSQAVPEIRDNYEFAGFTFLRESIEEELKRIGSVDVFGASLYCWSNTYTLALAKAVKEANPSCLTVLGGPHVPNRSEDYFQKHPYIDVLVHNEGEATFAEVLLEQLKPQPRLKGIKGTSVPTPGGKTIKADCRERAVDLDALPSPYLDGVFDRLMEDGRYDFHPTSETHRGCGFSCS